MGRASEEVGEVERTRLIGFPAVVNDVAARVVATGVVALSATYLLAGRWSVLVAVTVGFVLRVASGPRLSPLALLATRVIVPWLGLPDRPTPGPPKRFAQSIGATLSLAAVLVRLTTGSVGASQVLVGLITVAAALEAGLGICLGCRIFAVLMRVGIIPPEVCEACADISQRSAAQPLA